MKDGKAHQLSIRIKGTSFIVGTAKSVTCSSNDYKGRFESASCTTIKGWLWDKNFPDVRQIIELFEGDTIYATLTANVYREDRKIAGYGDGYCGFTMATPAIIKDGQQHQLSARIKGSSYVLLNSPLSVTCASPARVSMTDDSDTSAVKKSLDLFGNEFEGKAIEVVVAPNPTSGKFWIEFTPTQQSAATVFVSGQNGVVALTEELMGKVGQTVKHEIDLSSNPSGVYIIQLRYDGMKMESKKVILVK
ncbi:T9SS type A sorting domain-containing protein [Dyadobacter luticola]|uniref:T9SS type A sorting domain-containing protein n=1 Tax=Dyadobacter luticola TaxID=1979387 RepID=A0A5R9L1S5_9BACT|nr:T9SS type A sorting domain-containing protein [Dyadobacter luticola]